MENNRQLSIRIKRLGCPVCFIWLSGKNWDIIKKMTIRKVMNKKGENNMKTLILYESSHHGNTRKLVDAIAEKYQVDTVEISDAESVNLEKYERIGLACGIAFGRLYKNVEDFAVRCLPEGKEVFVLYTCGRNSIKYTERIEEIIQKKGSRMLGAYGCLGFDTYGPFKLVGGIAKGHPTEKEIQKAVEFYESL